MLYKPFVIFSTLLAAALLASCAAPTTQSTPLAAAPQRPTFPANDPLRGTHTFNIRDYGAVGDGKTLDTAALQTAIDACTADGGGTVLVPAGTFHIGTTELKSNVTLHIAAGGTLLGSGDGKNYHGVDAIPLFGDTTLNDGHWALLFAVGAKNVTVEGPGLIEGNGARFHPEVRGTLPPAGIGGNRRPYIMLFHQCTNLTVRDIDLFRSGYHMLRVIQSQYCHFDNIHMYNRVSGNNDGFHFISAEHVSIDNCKIEVQDDACALFGSCKDITVTNSYFSTRWSVFRFGGGNPENLAVSNCILAHVYGCPIKFQGTAGSVFQNFSFSNILLDDVTGPISISIGSREGRRNTTQPGSQPATQAASQPRIAQDYNPEEYGSATRPSTQPTTRRAPCIVRNISFTNIHGTVTTNPTGLKDITFPLNFNPGEKMSAIVLNSIGDSIMENISFDNIHLTFGGGGTAEDAHRDPPKIAGEYFTLGPIPAYGFYARNVHGVTLSNIRFETATPDLRPAMVLDHVQDVNINNISAQANKDADALLRFIDAKEVLITTPRILTPASTFLRVEGADSSSIIVDGGDLTKAATPLTFTAGAAEGSAKIRTP